MVFIFLLQMCIDDDCGNPIDRSGILNPFISLFNHSCDPMVTHYVNGDINAIISLQNIKKGEQASIFFYFFYFFIHLFNIFITILFLYIPFYL